MNLYTYFARGRRRPAVLVAIGGLAVQAACGWGPAAGGSQPAPRPKAPGNAMPGMKMPGGSGAAPRGAPVAANAVSIKSFAFGPASVSVKVGTTVTWTNQDEEPHTVTADGGAFRSSTLASGKTFRFTFTKPGSYPYSCTIHPFMRGTVVVRP
ncbi:plastocyanin/azurin family copper-binding protein [Actinoallomurus sp. NPDC050550]|uniref:plastocyanin/azurin family copper-binding protein n=1 Tax=Actinoallomurus sp. NPDC050550 TaxID=3154937 RepID=UPI003409BD96